ncbi:MAG: polyribonucleotide nucleotidyltransferase [Candidatus Liptonbacteria bacterium]|nr:polyribonucleotide nucleotidyltransferase [Candidatus Liptonbacteria bacterium]
MSFQRKTFTTTVGDKKFSLEFSPLAAQANASVIGTYGDTVVLAAVIMGDTDRDTDFFPLTVDYEERFYAAGKILGSRFVRRESRPSEEAVLSGRLVDRAIRPLFDHRLRRDVQVVLTILSYDGENDPDVIGLLSASAALAASDIPWNGPVAGIRVARINNRLVFNPTMSELRDGTVGFHAFVSGTGDTINMLECEGSEAPEEQLLAAFETSMPELKKFVSFQRDIVKEVGAPKAHIALVEWDLALVEEIRRIAGDRLRQLMTIGERAERRALLEQIKTDLRASFPETDLRHMDAIIDDEVNVILHRQILEKEQRPDGRALDELRDLRAEVKLFERTHGSALFMRGTTHALAVVTLAPPGAEQLIESIETTGKRRFLLHYNFPKYSVGEIGAFRGPGRREIGHGALAEKALRSLIPSRDEFPYTIRIVSEILSSNGSSSMATVCAGTLSLMDAGVPIKKPVAGIAMGLIMDENAPPETARYKVLTDIQGPEDHHGDMDFKVAGTHDGVTAVQMDVKIGGVTLVMLRDSLAAARNARMKILDVMTSALAAPRPALSAYAPKVVVISIDPEKIGDVIGSGGKIINGIIAETGTTIDIEEDGRIFVAGPTKESVDQAIATINGLVRDFEIGELVDGTVVRVLEFGAIVDLGGGKDGMIHISELKSGYVEKVTDVLNIGDAVTAKVIRVENGKIGLSLKQARQ